VRDDDLPEGGGYSGAGITKVEWSPCGRYLYIAERKSDGALVYDIRVAGKRLGWLGGRKAVTWQRLGIDAVRAGEGHEVWAGGTDGKVRMWKGPSDKEGLVEASFEWDAGEDPVVAALVHPSGTVAATCFGQHRRTLLEEMESTDSDDEDTETSEDSFGSASKTDPTSGKVFDRRLKIWSL